jgi:hypothetical protein
VFGSAHRVARVACSHHGRNQLSKVILGVKFADGLEVASKPTTGRQPASAAA